MATRRIAVPVEDNEIENEPQDTAPKTFKRSGRLTGPIASGWGAPAQELTKTVKAPYLRVDRTKKIIKILDEMPVVRFRQHYIKSLNRFFTCIAETDYDEPENSVVCPLCKAGDSAADKFMMNVVEMEDPDTVKTWTFGPEVKGHLQSFAEETITSPLNKETLYFKVYQVKNAQDRTSNKVEAIKARDLPDDYQLEPLNEKELNTLSESLYGKETIWITATSKLEEVARSI